MAAAPEYGFRGRGWFIAVRPPMDPNGSTVAAILEQEIHEAQEQLALGGDVEFVVQALLMILDSVDAELQPRGDLRGRIAEQDQSDDFALARRQLLAQVRVNRIAVIDRRQAGILATAASRRMADGVVQALQTV